MKRSSYFFLLSVAILIGVMHYAGTYLYLYWRVAGFDRIVHVVSGFFVAYVVLCIIYSGRIGSLKTSHVFAVGLFSALAIGLGWEIFELQNGMTSLQSIGFWPDTAGDIASDFVGGLLASWYFNRT